MKSINRLKLSGFSTYHQVDHSKILHGARFAFSVLMKLKTNSDLCHLQHKLIGFYNRDEKCLQRGTDWVFK